MFYVDTSVIIAYYHPEPLSETAETFLMHHVRPGISNLSEVEMASALSRKIREGGLSRKDAAREIGKFIAHVEGGFYTHLFLQAQHFRLARDWIGLFHTKLRTLDALHLALAFAEGRTLVTADEELVASAKSLSVDCLLLKR